MTEDQLQAKCYQWAVNTYKDLRFGCIFHVPNGGTRNKIEAQKLKATGVVAGIPDLIVLHDFKAYGIELKTEIGKVSDKQVNVHQAWRKQGIEVFTARTFEEFETIIKQIML